MAIDFKVPDLGENVESGDIVNVLVKEGDEIQAEQSVMEIETGKAVVELPCPFPGRITKVHVHKGSKVKVGDSLLTVEGAAASAGTKAKAPAPAKATVETPPKVVAPERAEKTNKTDKSAKVEAEPTDESLDGGPDDQQAAIAKEVVQAPLGKPKAVTSAKSTVNARPASAAPTEPAAADKSAPAKTPPAGPATRRLARELGVDLSLVEGSGPHGRISEEDVKSAVREHATTPTRSAVPSAMLPEGVDDKDAWGAIRLQKMSGIRKAIAVNMARSSSTIPHVTNFDDADITELERIRKGGLSDYVGTEIKLTMMAFVMKAVAQALKLHPLVNASVDMDNEQIVYKQYVHIGVAVDTERGLVVPVVRDVDQMSIPRIAQALTTVTEQARKAALKLNDMRGGTFTISNLGAIGGSYSTPIINLPEVAVLLLGRSRKLPVVVEGDKTEIRLMMPLSLSYDHRIVDGATAARFLNEVISYLKVPGRLLLAP
jgi:pyruvate dehydrogenase E2 component (dihydrolipoamide acetyltransferase)